ncbi:unnamed protein product [Darwinula stevensoni]|uniref:Uncharacterized protein n=1 Tax=Darwinula stevensoni TaxID=69355 RepID=A0A7R8X6I0_9CRUS|nr:unnamed protein product [Darwinula stevensoni]CAG0879477.1 unnamed protein product [Darwinula stevensoni]
MGVADEDVKDFLWNILRNKTSDVIEIIFTEEDFSPEEGTFVLKVGRGIKYEIPFWNDETVLYKFDGPVSENTSVYVENDDAWIHLYTSRVTRPFKIFYFVIDASFVTQEFHVTGLNGTIEYREEDPVIQMPKRYVWHLSGPPGTGWDFQLQYLDLNGGQNEFLYIGGGREVQSSRSGMILSNKEMQNKRSIRVATNDAVVYMVIPVRTTEWIGGFSLLFTRYGNETEMTTTTEEPSMSVLPIPSGDPPSITVLLRHPKRKLQNLVTTTSSFTFAITAHDAETWMFFQNLTKEIARACEDYVKENNLSSTSITNAVLPGNRSTERDGLAGPISLRTDASAVIPLIVAWFLLRVRTWLDGIMI